jgi:hypothetical protein
MLLYALQIVVLFREQLVHLYHVATDGRADHGIVEAVVDRAKRMFHDDGRQRIAAAHGAPAIGVAVIEGKHGGGDHDLHHHASGEKSRERKHRRDDPGFRPIANLFLRTLRRPFPEGTDAVHPPFDLIHLMRFSEA